MKRSPLFIAGIVVLVTLIVSIMAAYIIRGGVFETTLSEVTLQERINQSVEPKANTLNPPKRNYTVRGQDYFEEREWIVATVADTSTDQTDPATLILQNQNNEYVTVLGPGTSFPKSLIESLPKSVQDYLTVRDLVFDDQGGTDE